MFERPLSGVGVFANRGSRERGRTSEKFDSQKGGALMKTKVVLAIVALSYVSVAVAGKNAAYPSEKVAEFVIAKLDVNSLPSVFRPQKEKGKRTFADYGFTVQKVDESEAIVAAPSRSRTLAVKVLDRRTSGIYVCVAESDQSGSEPKTQSVIFLRRKDPNALLEGRESFREYTKCPVIGSSDPTENSYGGD